MSRKARDRLGTAARILTQLYIVQEPRLVEALTALRNPAVVLLHDEWDRVPRLPEMPTPQVLNVALEFDPRPAVVRKLTEQLQDFAEHLLSQDPKPVVVSTYYGQTRGPAAAIILARALLGENYDEAAVRYVRKGLLRTQERGWRWNGAAPLYRMIAEADRVLGSKLAPAVMDEFYRSHDAAVFQGG